MKETVLSRIVADKHHWIAQQKVRSRWKALFWIFTPAIGIFMRRYAKTDRHLFWNARKPPL